LIPELDSPFWRREKISSPCQEERLNCSASSLVTVPTEVMVLK